MSKNDRKLLKAVSSIARVYHHGVGISKGTSIILASDKIIVQQNITIIELLLQLNEKVEALKAVYLLHPRQIILPYS